MKVVGFVGPFSETNYGDYAMGINDFLEVKYKKAIIFTYNLDFVVKIVDKYVNNRNISFCEVLTSKDYIPTYSNKYNVIYDESIYTKLDIENKIINKDDVSKEIDKIDTLVVTGGGFQNYMWLANHRIEKLFAMFYVILIANEKRKQIVFMPNTFGPFNKNKTFSNMYCELLDAHYSFRDIDYSKKELQNIGINTADLKMDIVIDDCYFIFKRIKQQSNIIDLPREYIVFELYESIDFINKNKEKIKNILNDLRNKLKCEVVFLPLDINYGGIKQQEEIKKEIPFVKTVAHLENGYLKIEDIKKIVQNAKLVICERHHLFLSAISLRIPVIQILKSINGDNKYYYNKEKGLIDMIYKNMSIDENVFFETFDALKSENIINKYNKQRKLIGLRKKINELCLLRKRKRFIKNIEYM